MKRSRPRPSRRQFLRTLAVGTAAAIATPAMTLAADSKEKGTKRKSKRSKQRGGELSQEVREGIEEQKKYLRDVLKAIRDHELPTNSEQALVFRPMKAGRRAK